MHNSESKSETSFNLLMPLALLIVLLIVPFSINALMHMLASKKLTNPIIMKIPFDSTTITIPSKVKQYESFEVALNLDTKQLSKFLNEIVATASEGTAIQGITGVVSPVMKAEVISEDLKLDKSGQQEPLSTYLSTANWRWWITPESSGAHSLKFQLHLSTSHNGQQSSKVLNFAEANFLVESNLTEWINRHGLWIALLLIAPAIIVWKLRHHQSK